MDSGIPAGMTGLRHFVYNGECRSVGTIKPRHFGRDAEIQAMDGNLPLCKCLIQYMQKSADSHPCDWIPAIHAGMTGLQHLCITASGDRGNDVKAKSNSRESPALYLLIVPTLRARRYIQVLPSQKCRHP